MNAKMVDGATPLHICARYGHLEVARALIEAGADVNVKDGKDVTPLQDCVCGSYDCMEGILRVLITAGADFDEDDRNKATRRFAEWSGWTYMRSDSSKAPERKYGWTWNTGEAFHSKYAKKHKKQAAALAARPAWTLE